ncbi:3-oxoadipate--succinyl-CoA transferase subunit B [Synergistales bacterium]|nr:3-oxoadipate--succinyl-CoA transferase subunit B [Synergistales bacterium]
MEYNGIEMLLVQAARQVKKGELVFAGVGLPIMAMAVAKKFYVSDITIICESGIVDTMPTRLTMSIADPSLAMNCTAILTPMEIFSYFLQSGRVDVGVLGGAQVDRFGNVNSTVIGPYEKPKLRMPGSGGACEIASNAKEIMIMIPQSKRRFMEKVDFITSPGHMPDKPEVKKNIRGGGPRCVVSDLGLFEFENQEMMLTGLFEGITVERIKENTGWELRCIQELKKLQPPSQAELDFIRSLDPQGVFLGKVS